MAHSVHHDPFARGAFKRTSLGSGECAWCGQKRKRVFTYAWVSDGALDGQPSVFVRYQATHVFCNFACFEPYHA
jgi:hypothetical protein